MLITTLERLSIKWHFLLAFFIRILFTVYGLYHDSKSEKSLTIPKYTDIDYQVFTDAANYVYRGQSPYYRDTYRYTPILAILMQPNIFLFESFGKLLFVLFDLLCGYLILEINDLKTTVKTRKNNQQLVNKIAISFWFYNPITIAISSRGNAESLMAFLVLAFIFCLKKDYLILAGFFYAFSLHFKIYPVTYGLAILFYLANINQIRSSQSKFKFLIDSIVLNGKVYKFGLSALLTLSILTITFYLQYGYPFLHETYLYHWSRQDIRHNFSPYFYMLYLTDQTWNNSLLLRLFNFLPQFFLIVIFSVTLNKEFELCLFLITYSFVTFNKVCTAQYFVWYLCLIPILLPRLKISLLKSIIYFGLWMFGQALWLYFAYKLEFNGENTFLELWISSMIFLCINCYLIKNAFLDNYYFEDLNIKIR